MRYNSPRPSSDACAVRRLRRSGIRQTAIAYLLQVSRATISRDVAALRNAGDRHLFLS